MLIKSLLLTFFISSTSVIGDSLYNFEDVKDEERFYSLIKEIRCPKCTSGSLASSNAPVSEDIKKKIIQLIKEGKIKNPKAFSSFAPKKGKPLYKRARAIYDA